MASPGLGVRDRPRLEEGLEAVLNHHLLYRHLLYYHLVLVRPLLVDPDHIRVEKGSGEAMKNHRLWHDLDN